MRAYRCHRKGRAATMGVEEVPPPEAGPGEVLVRVAMASLNPVDWKIAAGEYSLLLKGGFPRTLGVDFAGEIAAVGPGVADRAGGEAVMGFVDPFMRIHGTFAELVPVPAAFVVARPATIDARLGAALPCAGSTAVSLCNIAQVGAGSRVLVNGASGGVGHLAMQVAKARGARVTAVASAARMALAQSLGADDFIDYRSVGVDRWPGGFDAVLDCVPNLARGVHGRLLRRGGHYASTLPGAATYTVDPLLNRLGHLSRHAVSLAPDAAVFDELFRHVDAGRLRCEIAGEFTLASAADAMAESRRGHVAGKLLVRIA